jgi:membrane protein involved in colicin uptake
MRRRYLVLGLSAVLAISLAVPALGGPGNPVASTAVTAAKALKKAKAANRAAIAAQGTANTALSTANQASAAAAAADQKATTADQKATNAQASADAAQASANAANANANNRFFDVVQVDGPPSSDPATSDHAQNSTATCPTGQGAQVTGGGWAISGNDNDEIVIVGAGSYAQDYGVSAEETDDIASTWYVRARAYCATKS